MNHLPLDFIATIQYKTFEEGGRSTPASNGYRPQLKFPFDKMSTSGSQMFIGKDTVYPGETINAEIRMLSSQYFEGRLTEGQGFKLMEGTRIIATGIIKHIVNEKLRKLKDSPEDLIITQAPLTPQDIQLLKDSYSFMMCRFGKVALYVFGGLALVYILPVLEGGRHNDFLLKAFFMYLVLPVAVLYLGVFIYFAPYKLWLDIRRNKKKVGIVSVKKIEGLPLEMRKDFFGMFDFKVTFEKEPFGLKSVIIASSLQPDLLKYKKFRVEIGPLSKKELKFEPVK